jgi:hypothetical protein
MSDNTNNTINNNKKVLGQFFTTNYDYILQNIKIPDNIQNIIEPFTGNGDLIEFVKNHNKNYNIECYDIEPKKDYIIKQDTLINPPDYSNKFIITNPPYLARNKSHNKKIYDKFNSNDLYKCFIISIINNLSIGGIIIIPLNFWSSIRKSDIQLRKKFLSYYSVHSVNVFEETVFNDTSYTICSFMFLLNNNNNNDTEIKFNIYPSKKTLSTKLNNDNNFIIGGELYNLQTSNKFNICRLTSKNITEANSNLVIKCIDDDIDNLINLSVVDDDDIYVDNTPNQTARTYATLIIIPKINIEKQKKLAEKFNKILNKYRKKYNSLFLTNYRESNTIARKRISFDLVYSLVKYILDNYDL